MRSKNLHILVEGAMMIALATVLSMIKFYEAPYGGSVTLEMLPLIVMGIRHGNKWGVFTGFVHGFIQLMMGLSNLGYCNGLLAQIGCILLDYLLAFAALGLARVFMFSSNNKVSIGCASIGCGVLRFICSFLSGWLLWGSYCYDYGFTNPVLYSLVYNAFYMVPSIILVTVVLIAISVASKSLIEKQD